MLKILDFHSHNRLANNHAKALCCSIRKRLNHSFLKDFFNDDDKIIDLLTKEPAGLKEAEEQIINKLFSYGYILSDILEESKKVFNYKSFFQKPIKPKYSAFDLCSNIGLRTCPYCNINLISTIKGLKGSKLILRPPIDHFYCFSKHPLLGLSFYNLIPSCWYCNSTFKLDEDTSIYTHLHPYLDHFSNNCQLQFTNFTSIDDILSAENPDYLVYFNNKTKDLRFDGNIKLFKLDMVYNEYKEILRSTLITSYHYPMEVVNGIMDIAKSTKTETYYLIFQSYFDDDNHNKFPFSKAKSDIVKEYSSDDLKDVLGIS